MSVSDGKNGPVSGVGNTPSWALLILNSIQFNFILRYVSSRCVTNRHQVDAQRINNKGNSPFFHAFFKLGKQEVVMELVD